MLGAQIGEQRVGVEQVSTTLLWSMYVGIAAKTKSLKF